MATEKTRLLRKPFDYLSTASITVNPKSKECIVVVPAKFNSDDHINQFIGLTLDELIFYTYDPFWRLIRRGIFISFWVLLVAIFASACIISVIENKQRCITTMKSQIPTNNLANVDVISRTDYALSSSGNSTLGTFILGATAIQ